MGGSGQILYCIILQKGVGGWPELKYNIILAADRRPKILRVFDVITQLKNDTESDFYHFTAYTNNSISVTLKGSTHRDRRKNLNLAARRARNF